MTESKRTVARYMDGFGTGNHELILSCLTEENDEVVAEGSVREQRRAGGSFDLVFCDVFEMRRGKIKRLISYLVEVK